jgi:hypothetical protein
MTRDGVTGSRNPRGPVQKAHGRPGLQPEGRRQLVLLMVSEMARRLKAEGGLEEDLAFGGGGAPGCAGQAGSGTGAAGLGSATKTESAVG